MLASACPDPCVIGGGACNENSDCAADQLCRVGRAFEGFGCTLVAGRCIDVEPIEDAGDKPCGSVDDCDDDECCDPATNTCVGELGYIDLRCDEATCRDCDETALGDRCETNDDCDDDEACTADDENGFGTIVEKGVCRPLCASDDECASDERCNFNGFCMAPIGTSCRVAGGADEASADDECLGLDCTMLDAANERVDDDDDGVCTAFCTEPSDCPSGFTCFDAANECRPL